MDLKQRMKIMSNIMIEEEILNKDGSFTKSFMKMIKISIANNDKLIEAITNTVKQYCSHLPLSICATILGTLLMLFSQNDHLKSTLMAEVNEYQPATSEVVKCVNDDSMMLKHISEMNELR